MKRSILFNLLLLIPIIVTSQVLSKETIREDASKILISNKFDISIIKISKIINNVCVAQLKLPYREFPDLLIYKYDSNEKKWIRIFEGLCPGIQDKPSGLLDWHTIRTGIDFVTNKDTIYDFDDPRVKILIKSMNASGGILIPYQNFLHMHTADSSSSKSFEPYVIDKTKYFDFALKLFGGKYNHYPKDQCMMFDSPNITDFDFTLINKIFQIKVRTDNNQLWTYTFSDVDKDNKYLIEKKIEVNNTR